MFDLTDLPTGYRDAPYPILSRLREDCPVCPQPDGSVVLSRHDDLDMICRDTRLHIRVRQVTVAAMTPRALARPRGWRRMEPGLTQDRRIAVGGLFDRFADYDLGL